MSPEKLQICHLKRLRRARQVGGRGEKVNPEKIWELTQKPLSLRVNPELSPILIQIGRHAIHLFNKKSITSGKLSGCLGHH